MSAAGEVKALSDAVAAKQGELAERVERLQVAKPFRPVFYCLVSSPPP